MQVIWSFQARQQLDDIVMYIAEDNLTAALLVDDLLRNAADGLRRFPQKGRIGRVAGTRELVVHSNYALVYACGEDSVNILSVLHTSRQYPPD